MNPFALSSTFGNIALASQQNLLTDASSKGLVPIPQNILQSLSFQSPALMKTFVLNPQNNLTFLPGSQGHVQFHEKNFFQGQMNTLPFFSLQPQNFPFFSNFPSQGPLILPNITPNATNRTANSKNNQPKTNESDINLKITPNLISQKEAKPEPQITIPPTSANSDTDSKATPSKRSSKSNPEIAEEPLEEEEAIGLRIKNIRKIKVTSDLTGASNKNLTVEELYIKVRDILQIGELPSQMMEKLLRKNGNSTVVSLKRVIENPRYYRKYFKMIKQTNQ